ncbi:MAG: hypothetical protein KBC84_09975 [Proteobacteria bacterium]|nr:hypothetical protein [Pseudomonadota bacterium]
MVKKIIGSRPASGATQASGIKETETVKSAKVDSVKQVSQVQQQSAIGKTKVGTRPLTPEERARLLQMVDEEADKLVSSGAIPESKKETITKSVKYTIAAGVLDEDKD